MVYAVDINQNNFAPARFGDISAILNLIIPTLIIGGGVLFFVMFIFAGFKYMSSGGNPENLKTANSVLKYSLLGLLIVVMSYFLVKLLASLFNISTPF